MTFKFTEMHCEKVGGDVDLFSRRIQTLSEHYKRTFGKKRDCFTIVKHVFLINGLCLETKQMWLKSVSHEKVTPVSNRGRFLSLK